MNQLMPKPVNVEEISPSELIIQWNDGVETYYTYPELRFNCWCAECRDEFTGKEIITRQTVPADIQPREIEPVGNYALRFVWSDGHSAGIYTFNHLRQVAQSRPENS